MTGFAIYFHELKTPVQKALLDELNLEDPKEANWHETPIALINPTNNPELPQKSEKPHRFNPPPNP